MLVQYTALRSKDQRAVIKWQHFLLLSMEGGGGRVGVFTAHESFNVWRFFSNLRKFFFIMQGH